MTGALMACKDRPIFLNWSALRPGDILLARRNTMMSRLIAAATLGPYSHASLVVSQYRLFEADAIGVGYTTRGPDRIEIHGQERAFLSRLSGIEAAVVLRHPGLDDSLCSALTTRLETFLRPHIGEEYPKWRTLAPAASGGVVGRALAGTVLKLMDTLDRADTVNPGSFCSKLVCEALDAAFPSGVMSFKKSTHPDTVAPNTFLRSELKAKGGLVCHADASVKTDDKMLAGWQAIPLLDRMQETGNPVATNRAITKMEKR